MNCKEIIVSDDSIIIALKSDDDEELEAAQYILEYLSWRKFNKEVLTLPKTYTEIKSSLGDNEELIRYFENYFEPSEFIGESDKNPDEVEFSTLLNNLWTKGNLSFFVSSNEDLRNKIKESKVPKAIIKSLAGMKTVLQNKPEFNQFIFEKYYDSTA